VVDVRWRNSIAVDSTMTSSTSTFWLFINRFNLQQLHLLHPAGASAEPSASLLKFRVVSRFSIAAPSAIKNSLQLVCPSHYFLQRRLQHHVHLNQQKQVQHQLHLVVLIQL
jgi:hypothetical protein